MYIPNFKPAHDYTAVTEKSDRNSAGNAMPGALPGRSETPSHLAPESEHEHEKTMVRFRRCAQPKDGCSPLNQLLLSIWDAHTENIDARKHPQQEMMVSAQKALENLPDLEGLDIDQIAAMMSGTVAMKSSTPQTTLSEIVGAINSWLYKNHSRIAFGSEHAILHTKEESPAWKNTPFTQQTFGQRFDFLTRLHSNLNDLKFAPIFQASEISQSSAIEAAKAEPAYICLIRHLKAHQYVFDGDTQNALAEVIGNLPAKITLKDEKTDRAIKTAVNGAELNEKQVALLQAAGNRCKSEPEMFGDDQEANDLSAFIIEISHCLNSGQSQ